MGCGCSSNCNCSDAITLPTPAPGAPGANGVFGGWSQRMVFDTTTSASPLANNMRMNNAAPASVTQLYVNDLNADGNNIDPFLDAFDNSGAFGKVKLFKQFDSNKFWMGDVTGVTDNGADHTLDVSYVAHNGTFDASDSVVISFTANGDSGVAYVSGTYSQISSMVGSLIPGGNYILTDYETKHEVPGTGITNQASSSYVAKPEQLKLTAKDSTSFFHEVESIDNPEDDILYNFADNTILGQARPGIIYKRKNNTTDVEAWFDVRNHVVARYGLDVSSIAYVADPVNRGDIVSTGSLIQLSVRDGAALGNFRLIEDISWIDQGCHFNANVSLFGKTINYDPSSITYHEAIGSVSVGTVKLAAGVNDVIVETSNNINIEKGTNKVCIMGSSDVTLGADSSQVILHGVQGVNIGREASNVYITSSNNIEIGKSVSGVFAYNSSTLKLGDNHTDLMLHKSNETRIGSGGSNITMNRSSHQNTIGDNCAGISLGNSDNNLFDQSCSDIEIYSGGFNRFAQGCNVINLIGEQDNAYTGIDNAGAGLNYYSPYSQMEHNTFGTGCSNISFNILGGRGNQFGDECKNLSFNNGVHGEEWRLVGCHFCRGIQNKTFTAIIHNASFVVPNQITQTITSADWYSQVLWFHHDTANIENVEMSASSSLFGTTNPSAGISFGYESALSQEFFTPTSTDVAGGAAGPAPATDLTTNQLRTAHIQCLAWMWTPEGYPLSMTFTPQIGSNTDPTVSLNR